MSDADVVRQMLEASKNDPVAALAFIDEGLRLYPRPAELGVKDVYKGLEGLEAYFGHWFSQWDEYTSEPIKFVDAGDSVLVVIHETGTNLRMAMELEEDFSHSFVVRDGKIVEWRMYDSYDQAREALGLR